MWANYEHLKQAEKEFNKDFAERQDLKNKYQILSATALVRAIPDIRSKVMHYVEHIEKFCLRIDFPRVSLCQSNADWLAITVLKNTLQPHVRQRLMLDLVREGALQNSVSRFDTSVLNARFLNAFIALHLAAFGTGDRFDLFKRCIEFIPVIEDELLTPDHMSEMEKDLATETSLQVFVGRLPQPYRMNEFWLPFKHVCNLRPPIKKDGAFFSDLSKIFTTKNTNRLQVRMHVLANRPHITVCEINLQVHFVVDNDKEKKVDTYVLTVVSIECEVRSKDLLPPIIRLPCTLGKLPMLEWPDFCKTMTSFRRGVDGLSIISVFLFFHLWNPRTRERLNAIVDMIARPEKNEVTVLITEVMSQYVIDQPTATKVRNKTKKLMLRFAQALELSSKLPFEVNVQYVSSATLFSSKD